MRVPTIVEAADYRSAKQIAYANALPGLQRKAKGGKVQTIDEFAFDYDGPQNAFATHSGEFLVDGEMRTFLIEVPTGDYVLYGTSVSGNAVVTCNCLGTVRFNAAAGVITNLGSLYADKVHKASPVPHLEDNLGPSMFAYGWILGEALVPATPNSPVPDTLKALPIVTAEFHAVGLFHEPGATSINRLAPVSGVLGYEQGRVIDLRTGQRVQ